VQVNYVVKFVSLHQSSCMTLITGEHPCFELCEHRISMVICMKLTIE